MPKNRTCPDCGQRLPEDALEGVCPVCSLRSALKFGPASTGPQPHDPVSSTASPLVRDFGDYELLEEIARGGMGIVYKARQKSLDRIVALKLLLFGSQASPEFAQRFRAEAVLAASLQHPNIVAIHEVGACEGQQFFVMDYVQGPSLARLVGHQPLPARRAAGYLKIVAKAIHYAHERGILHRDLKPSNVLIDAHDQPRVTDFGLARRLAGDSQVTLTGQVLGSPNYIPPEQALGRRGKVSRQSDVYALGAMLYHLLTGRPPFQGETLTDTLQQVLNTEPLAPRWLSPSVPRDLETICLKCLEKEPARRYATAQALAKELDRFLNGQPVLARPIGRTGKVWRWCRRQPVRAGLIAALVVVFVTGTAVALWQWRSARASALSALREVYAGDMKLAQRSIEDGSMGRALELLDKHRPARKGDLDFRSWEWRHLWGLCRSDELATISRMTGAIRRVEFSLDGKTLAAADEGGNIHFLDVISRRESGWLPAKGWGRAMALAPREGYLAFGNTGTNGQAEICLWDMTARRLIAVIPQPSRVNKMAFSPDGKLLATYHQESMAALWEMPSGKLVTNIPASDAINGDLRTPAFSPDGATLALGEMGGHIRLIKWRTGEESKPIPSPSEDGYGVGALAFSPDGRMLAAGYGYSDSIIRLWDAVTGALVGELKGHKGWVCALIFSSDGRTLFSASEDQTIRAWDVATRHELGSFQGHTDGVTGLALSPDGKTLASCAEDGTIRTWDPQAPPRHHGSIVLPGRTGPVGAAFTADSRRVVTASRTDLVSIWEAATGKPIETIPALGTNNLAVALSPKDRLLVIGGYEGDITVWDLGGQRVVRRLMAQPRIPIYWLHFFDEGESLISLATLLHRQVALQRWEVATWKEKPFKPIDVDWAVSLAQSPDNRFWLIGSLRGGANVWSCATATLEHSFTPQAGSTFSVAFSPDGRHLAAVVQGAAQVWEAGTYREEAALQPYANSVVGVVFSPDSRRLVTGMFLGGALKDKLAFWDFESQRELLSLRGHGSFVMRPEFSPDGNTLLATSWEGIVELWHAPSWAEIEAVERGAVSP